ncbi:MAG TPA: MgtC/SapB family protein [Candidatus Angelobacter sp.]|jgi:putative Mg2+ transporter-C (MgtC) family protein|nr:MgtC/SapB family protein [Candidatus Angelobacter sp.]
MTTLATLLPHITLANLLSKTLVRLALAAFLGGIIGLERELKHKPAGLRTNMFICFGSAMFTILSNELAGQWGVGDHTRIAAQIIPGIGFIGAGSILHDKGGVSGITTAATLFVVASIGMAAGGGLYLEAIFATMLIYLALHLLGILERQLNLKPLRMNYMIVSDKTADDLVAEVNSILENQGKEMQAMRLSRSGEKEKLLFRIDATRHEHKQLVDRLRQSAGLGKLETSAGMEID